MVTTLTAGQQGTGSPKSYPTMSPFLGHIWIHQDTLQDDLAKTCHEIWKRGQKSPDHLKPIKEEDEFPPESEDTKERVAKGSKKKDDIAHMVEQEYISLIIENALSAEFSMLSISPKKSEGEKQAISRIFFHDIPMKDQLKSSLANGDNKEAFQPLSTRPTYDMKSSRGKDPLGQKENSCIEHANIEVSRIMQLLEKPTVQRKFNEHTKSIPTTNDSTNLSCEGDKILEKGVTPEKKEFPAFSILCSKTGVDEVWHQINTEYWKSLDIEEISNQNVTGSVTTDVNFPHAQIKKCKRFISKAPGTKIDVKLEPYDDLKEHSQSFIKASNETEWLSKKNEDTGLNFPLADVGNYKLFSTDSPFKVPLIKTESKIRPCEVPKAKTSTSATVAVKPTFKSTTYYSSSTLRPLQSPVAVNAMIPPYYHSYILPTTSSFHYGARYQSAFHQRPPTHFALNNNNRLGGYSRQIMPFNQFQVGQPLFSAPYNQMVAYTPYMHAYYTWRPHITPGVRNLPPGAGEGPQYIIPRPHRYNVPPITRPILNYPYFISRGNGMKLF